MMSVVTSVASDTTSVVTMIIVILTGMIFMVMDTPQMHDRLRMAGSRKPDVVLALESFASGIRKYWLVTTVFGLLSPSLTGQLCSSSTFRLPGSGRCSAS
ncbi:permease [Cutibacterium acnes JCM 18909]|nr:permease [Cutibacterium acnes JCM 18909]